MKCKICKREKVERSWFWLEEKFYPVCLECELSLCAQIGASNYEIADFLDFRLAGGEDEEN